MWLWSAEEEIANDDGMGILNFTAAPHGDQSFRVDRLLVEVSPDSLAGEGELRVRNFLLIHVQPLDGSATPANALTARSLHAASSTASSEMAHGQSWVLFGVCLFTEAVFLVPGANLPDPKTIFRGS